MKSFDCSVLPNLQQEIDEDFVDEVEEVEKRNSELLNSLLAVPGGIHRAGK